MKSTNLISGILILIISITILPTLASSKAMEGKKNANSITISTIKTEKQTGRKTKDGRFKRKKGFLWGLFKSKKACDCPKL
jgi:hypothetical protein